MHKRYVTDTTILVSKETRERIKELAKKEGRTVKEFLKRVIEQYGK